MTLPSMTVSTACHQFMPCETMPAASMYVGMHTAIPIQSAAMFHADHVHARGWWGRGRRLRDRWTCGAHHRGTEDTERLQNEAFDAAAEIGGVEVQEEPGPDRCQAEVGEELSLVYRQETIDRLEFDNE